MNTGGFMRVSEFEVDRSAAEHDQCQCHCGFGAVETAMALGHGADLVVQSSMASVR